MPTTIIVTRLCPVCEGEGSVKKRKACKKCHGEGLIHKRVKAEKGCF